MFGDLIVLEFASVLAGPAVGMFFAELGATVIKVENPNTMGDVTRSWKLPSETKTTDISSYFSSVNWGKQSIAVNASTGEGQALLHELVKKADVVLASYKPGDDKKLHLDYNTLAVINPGIIYGHITGYGPDDQRAGYDAILQGASGFTYMNGAADGPPTKMPVALIDLLASHQLKEGLLLALLKRHQSGEGAYVHTSLLKSGIASLANQAANWLVAKTIPQRIGSDHPNVYPYGTSFPTKDGKEIVLGVGTDAQFKKLCQIIKRPELAAIPLYSSNQQRLKNRGKLHQLLSSQIAKFERDKLVDALNATGVPTGGILNMQEVFEQKAGQELLITSNSEGDTTLSGLRTIAFQGKFLPDSNGLSRPPHLNEHGESILREMLGYDVDRISLLKRQGAILWV